MDNWMNARHAAQRTGEWLEMPLPFVLNGERSPHPHDARRWLLEGSGLPAKWINRLFSTGGIALTEEGIRLQAFPNTDLKKHPLYALARRSSNLVPDVLYEDDHCLVFNKPAGMAVHPASPKEAGTLDEAALRHMLQTSQQQLVRHVHRLDRDTSGPVLYTKTDLAQWQLDEALRLKTMGRIYLAVVTGRIRQDQGTLKWPIGRDRHHPARRRVTPQGDQAVTHYEVIERSRFASLVRVQLETGRTHQIRVHLSHLGHPLVGDSLYGGSTAHLAHQALHGERLVFDHPWTGEPVTVNAGRPAWLATLWKDLGGEIS